MDIQRLVLALWPRRSHSAVMRTLPLFAALSCAGCASDADDGFLILGSIAVVFFFAGLGVGAAMIVALVRLADTAAAKYHRASLARILDGSSGVNDLVQEIVSTTQPRIAALRRELRRLKEAA